MIYIYVRDVCAGLVYIGLRAENEHSFYMHNKKGLVLIQNVTMERVGRTCVQSVNRNVET
eukprot:COSAG06_NODE_65578_length_256_cov_1.324841_1_plen_59_part_01